MKRKTSITKIASILTVLAMVWGGGSLPTANWTRSSCRANKIHNFIWFRRWINYCRRRRCCYKTYRSRKNWLFIRWMAQWWSRIRLDTASHIKLIFNCKMDCSWIHNHLSSRRCWNRQPNNLHNRNRNFWIKSSNKSTRCN
jgi:hypothetical protein